MFGQPCPCPPFDPAPKVHVKGSSRQGTDRPVDCQHSEQPGRHEEGAGGVGGSGAGGAGAEAGAGEGEGAGAG